jgi:hypothetical protein
MDYCPSVCSSASPGCITAKGSGCGVEVIERSIRETSKAHHILIQRPHARLTGPPQSSSQSHVHPHAELVDSPAGSHFALRRH